jgi:hypothetical protein
MDQHTQETVKVIGDTLSVFTVVGTLVNMLPSIAALFTIVWTALRIYESATVQGYLTRRRKRAK